MKVAYLLAAASLALYTVPLHAEANAALPPNASGTFPGFGAIASLDNFYNSVVASEDTLPAGTFVLGYDAATRSYHIQHGAADLGTAFTPAQLASTTPSDEAYILTNGTGPVGYKYYSLTVHRNVDNNPAIDLSYMTYVFGSTAQRVGAGQTFDQIYAAVIGQVTSAAVLPHSGAVYYSGIVDGYRLGSNYGDSDAKRLSGTGNIQVNFYTGEIATGLNISAAGGFLGHVDGRGSIATSSSAFAGDLFGSGNSLLGRFNGSLFGPAAQEAGYGFSLSDSNGAILTGALATKQASLPSGSTPASPPTAFTGSNSTLLTPLVSDTFPGIASRLMRNAGSTYGYNSGSSATVAEALQTGAIIISYDAATASYTVADGSTHTTFSPDTRDRSSNATATSYTIQDFVSGQHLIVLNNGPANPSVQLTYLGYGLWTDGEIVQQRQSNYRTFIYGVETAAADLPRSGAALYNGAVDGYWAANGSVYRLQGSDGSILANFYTGEVRTTMRLAGVTAGTDYTSAPAPIRVDGYGSITAGTTHYSGAAATADASYSGRFQGAFYGPAHEEAGLSFVLRGPTSISSISGVLVAAQVPLH